MTTRKEEFLKECMVLDTETNSSDYAVAEIIEAGFVTRDNGNWTIFQELHKPEHPIPPKVQSICYITNQMVMDKPAFKDARDVFQGVVDRYQSGYLVAHNHFYDMRVLANHGIDTTNHTWICTWRLAKKMFANSDDIEETNLPYLRFALELDVPIELQCHRAGNDSYITAKLLEVVVDYLEMTGVLDPSLPYGPQVAHFSQSPIIYERMPFGKHKGQLMTDVPVSYWNWAMNNTHWFDETADNFDPDLLASISRALKD